MIQHARDPGTVSFLTAVEALIDLLALPPGWNSYSAKPITAENAKTTIRILASLLDEKILPPTVVPRVKGNIQLEWHTKNVDIEVYIDSPETISFFAEDVETGEVVEASLAGREEDLKKWLRRAPENPGSMPVAI